MTFYHRKVLKMWIQLKVKEEINDNVPIGDFLFTNSKTETLETSIKLDSLDNV